MSAALPYEFETPELHERRERVFIVLAGFFLGAMAILNIIGITRFIHIGPLALAVGVLPYPLTFLCTDLISEFYGRRRANFVVWVGLALNVFVIGMLWLGNALPAMDFKADFQRISSVQFETVIDPATGDAVINPRTGLPLERPVVSGPDGKLVPVTDPKLRVITDPETDAPVVDPATGQPVRELVDAATGVPIVHEQELFNRLYIAARGAVLASMLAYLAAQFCDVFLFHFWKRLTRGKYLWLRNNGSTMISQLVDATMVVSITFGASVLAGEMTGLTLLTLIASNYAFKFAVALIDTIPIYLLVWWLKGYLKIDPTREHQRDAEASVPPPAGA